MCSWPATLKYLVSANDYDEFISWELIYLTIEAYLRRTSVAARGHSWASWAQLRRKAGRGGSFSSVFGV